MTTAHDMNIFISYKRGEGDKFAELIESKLIDLKVKIWRDVTKIGYGDHWSPQIDTGINNAIALILVVTPSVANSLWVTYEWSRAMGNGVPIIPIKFLDLNDNDLHDQIRSIMYADYTKDGDRIWPKVFEALGNIMVDHPTIRIDYLLDQAQNLARPIEYRKQALDDIRHLKSKDLVDKYLAILRDSAHQEIHSDVIANLALLGDPKAVRDLLEALEFGDIRVSGMASFALSTIADASTAPQMQQYLESPDSQLRNMAAEIMGKTKYEESVEKLSELVLFDPIEAVRWNSAKALGQIGDVRAVQPLIQATKDSNVNVRHYAVEALGLLKDPQAVPSLIDSLKDNDFYHGKSRICDVAAVSLRLIPSEEGRRAALIFEKKQPKGRRH